MALEVSGVPPPLTVSLDFRTTLRIHAPRIKSIKGNDSPINLARHCVKISRSKIHFWEGEKREGKQREIVISYYFQGWWIVMNEWKRISRNSLSLSLEYLARHVLVRVSTYLVLVELCVRQWLALRQLLGTIAVETSDGWIISAPSTIFRLRVHAAIQLSVNDRPHPFKRCIPHLETSD